LASGPDTAAIHGALGLMAFALNNGAPMKFEPRTFLIGIIDLFSTLLPGALVTALRKRAVETAVKQ